MAEKRMFTKKIVDSDPFKEMPLSAQALYFHLGMNADDEGFLNNAKSVQRSILASDDDMKLLIAKNFIISFESGIVVIKHWKMHNQIQPSRLKPTQYTEEKSLLCVKENKSYTFADNLSTECRHNDSKCCPRLDKNRLDKISIDQCSVEDIVDDSEESQPHAPKKKVKKHRYGEYDNVLLSDDEMEKLKKEFPDIDERIERLSSYVASTGKKYKSHYATIRNWARKDKEQPKAKSRNQFNNFPQRERTATEMSELEKTMLHRSIPTKTVNDDP